MSYGFLKDYTIPTHSTFENGTGWDSVNKYSNPAPTANTYTGAGVSTYNSGATNGGTGYSSTVNTYSSKVYTEPSTYSYNNATVASYNSAPATSYTNTGATSYNSTSATSYNSTGATSYNSTTSYNNDKNTGSYNSSSYYPTTTNTDTTYKPNRFLPPGQTKRKPMYKKNPLKRKLDADAGNMFLGRDPENPEELNALFKNSNCDLCKVQLNSMKTAQNHYVSKAHDKSITNWLLQTFDEKGLEAPPVKRFYKAGPVGPEAFHCEPCDLKLTSKSHAEQHYSGRKHRLVVTNISNPSGSGYYNEEGKWVRTATKVTVDNDGRFGIGAQFKSETAADSTTATSTDDTTAAADAAPKNAALINTAKAATAKKTPTTKSVGEDESLYCKVCNVRVTSTTQMTLHLEGSKHRKKLVAAGESPSIVAIKSETILHSLQKTTANDLSMYRTPSGSFYCKVCNLSMNIENLLVQHLQSKKHAKMTAAGGATVEKNPAAGGATVEKKSAK